MSMVEKQKCEKCDSCGYQNTIKQLVTDAQHEKQIETQHGKQNGDQHKTLTDDEHKKLTDNQDEQQIDELIENQHEKQNDNLHKQKIVGGHEKQTNNRHGNQSNDQHEKLTDNQDRKETDDQHKQQTNDQQETETNHQHEKQTNYQHKKQKCEKCDSSGCQDIIQHLVTDYQHEKQSDKFRKRTFDQLEHQNGYQHQKPTDEQQIDDQLIEKRNDKQKIVDQHEKQVNDQDENKNDDQREKQTDDQLGQQNDGQFTKQTDDQREHQNGCQHKNLTDDQHEQQIDDQLIEKQNDKQHKQQIVDQHEKRTNDKYGVKNEDQNENQNVDQHEKQTDDQRGQQIDYQHKKLTDNQHRKQPGDEQKQQTDDEPDKQSKDQHQNSEQKNIPNQFQPIRDLKFCGMRDPVHPKLFIKNFEHYAVQENLNEEEKQNFFIGSLRKYAEIWLKEEGYGTYDEMKKAFLSFYWSSEKQDSFTNYLDTGKYTKKSKMSMANYFFKHAVGAKFLDSSPGEEEIIGKLLKHFDSSIEDEILIQKAQTIEQVIEILKRIDILRGNKKSTRPRNKFSLPDVSSSNKKKSYNSWGWLFLLLAFVSVVVSVISRIYMTK